jgi:hypothetical protein
MTLTQRRLTPRKAVGLELTLTRRKGSPIAGWTLDLGGGGMRVATDRPLGVDEELEFELALGEGHPRLGGRARVLREHAQNVYALRFEDLPEDELRAVVDFVTTG